MSIFRKPRRNTTNPGWIRAYSDEMRQGSEYPAKLNPTAETWVFLIPGRSYGTVELLQSLSREEDRRAVVSVVESHYNRPPPSGFICFPLESHGAILLNERGSNEHLERLELTESE